MNIISIDLAKLRNAEYLQFSKDVLQIVLLNNPAGLSVQAQYNAFQGITAQIESLFASEQANELTELIAALDKRRDDAITGISIYVESLAYHFNQAKSQAAMRLGNNLKLYGSGIARQNYMAETATIDSIIGDWNTDPELQSAIAVLDLADWKAELIAANNEFNTQYILRTQQLGAQSHDTIKAKRLESINLYYALRNMIDAYFVIGNGIAPWAKACNEINALIEQYNVLLAGRASEPNPEPNPPQG
jgi:hypothetical protein